MTSLRSTGRLKVGADITLRRTVKGAHGDDVVPTGAAVDAPHIQSSETAAPERGIGIKGVGVGGKGSSSRGGDGGGGEDEGTAGDTSGMLGTATATPAPAATNAAPVHCDSWDGTVVCFGLCSTKLGTPVYPVRTLE